ncbi:ATP-binding protein [Bradymonadaceae bacterium TMQ3]|nr:ATP-binding protein [Bradymonadaceae bacterium TMQ3]TXC67858.1 ATP-binding protein [Bradymonadales bacterium TMQ1]
MLIEFRVENHRSIREEQVLTAEAAAMGDAEDVRPRHMSGHTKTLVPVMALYGPNASGKSTVLSALAFMTSAVASSFRHWDPDGGVPRQPFAWGPFRAKPSLFELTFLIEGTRFEYGFAVDDERILEEWLYAWPKGRRQIWFERDGQTFKFGESLRGPNKVVEEVTRDNALFLSTSFQLDHEQLRPVVSWFHRVDYYGLRDYAWYQFTQRDRTEQWLRQRLGSENDPNAILEDDHGDPEESSIIKSLLASADVGIVDFEMRKTEEIAHAGSMRTRLKPFFKHASSDADSWLPLDAESEGTRALFYMAPALSEALKHGSLYVIDELDRSFHPVLVNTIIKLFNNPETNPKNAQLLFATHNTHLLGNLTGEPALRRDQIWLTEKNEEGATCIYPLTDYKPRKSENLERGYLQGRYGAIPFPGELVSVSRDSQ